MRKTLSEKSLTKGRDDFRRKVTLWGIEGGSIRTCPRDPSILLKSESGPQGGYDVIADAWSQGFISSDKSAGMDLLEKILSELPEKCADCDCD